jgi:small conductance mechanosensitive channel
MFRLPSLTPDMQSAIVTKGTYLLLGLAVLVIAHHIGVFVRRIIYQRGQEDIRDLKRATTGSSSDSRQQIKKTRVLYIILGQVAYYAILSVAGLLVLKLFGIEATSIIALTGAAGFTAGLALQGTLSDIASGVLLGLFQTYTIGDLVELEGGVRGRVKDFNLTRTILTDLDTNALIIVPNRKISESTVINHSKSEQRRIKFQINVSNSYVEFEKLIATLKDEVIRLPGVLTTPDAPIVGVENMGEVGTIITVKLFIANDDYPALVLPIQSRVRQILADLKVPMVDPF